MVASPVVSSVVPPPLPPGEIVPVAGVGELFVRRCAGPADACPVLLLHGWQATADVNFLPLYAPLAQRHPVVAFDLRGHGRSFYPEERFTIEDAAGDAAALLRRLETGPVIVVGYSMGTAVAQAMAHHYRDAVAGIVLVAGELAPDRRPHEKVYDRLGGWLGTMQRLTSGRRTAHHLVSKAAQESPSAEHLRGWLVREMERGHVASLRAAGRALARFDGRALAEHRGQLPVATVITTRDRLVKPSRQHTLAEAWGAPKILLDADHDAPIAQPGRFVDATLGAIAAVTRTHEATRASA